MHSQENDWTISVGKTYSTFCLRVKGTQDILFFEKYTLLCEAALYTLHISIYST